MPLANNSIDLVYTVHALEPNGGKELEALKELYRVASKYVVLVEPYYEGANSEAKERMDRLGYIKGIRRVR
ncbi:Methyltransferase domain-containing protein OS=Lysinibacillus sphaericus OX=1421 GN=LS41612_21290 PE=4 SV=1 [Lysinibacillus sphaericus]